MRAMVEEMYREFKKGRGEESSTSKQDKGVEEPLLVAHPEGKGKEEKPSPPSPPSSPSSSSSSHKESPEKKKKKSSLIKLDVKFDLSVYDGELNVEKLDNWIRQIDLYCRLQNIDSERRKIQRASLCLGGTTLVWWEGRTKADLKKHGKILSTWYEFVFAIKKQFYPLAYMQQAMMSWQTLRQLKGKSVQSYTQEFRKRVLILGISLDSPETLLKYIEARGKNVNPEVGGSSKPTANKNKEKRKEKWKERKANAIQKTKPSCTHCKKDGHDDEHCWILHPELRPKRYDCKNKKNYAAIQKDLGLDLGDETTIATTGIKGTNSEASTSNSAQSTDNGENERKRHELFHIRVISKNQKIDTLFDSGSQVNLIFEAIVKKLGLLTTPHKRPYPLGWLCDKAKLQVTRQCKRRFAIGLLFLDEVELDVIPLDIVELF
eukprot:PITA_32857